MTIITKPSFVLKKPPLVVDNVSSHSEEDRVDIYPHEWRRRPNVKLVCLSVTAVMITIFGIGVGLALFKDYIRSNGIIRNYQGFCSVPISPVSAGLNSNSNSYVATLRWSPEPDVQVLNAGNEEEEVPKALREEFEIGNRLETIRVYDNNRMVSFIHDFDDNITGIVDQDRCFMMDLNPSLVLPPDMLVLGIENGDDFDITRIRSTLRAVLPALKELARQARVLAEQCMEKPTYRLQKEEGVIIRKRAVDAPSHDYIQFSGKKVQEIEISNLAQLLQSEQDLKQRG